MKRTMSTLKTTMISTALVGSIVTASFVAVVLPFLPSTDAWAQASSSKSVDLSVNPPVTYLAVKPGETQKHVITIKQNGVTPLTVTPRLVSFKADGSTGRPLLSYSSEFKHYTLELPSGISHTGSEVIETENTENSVNAPGVNTAENTQTDPTRTFTLLPGEQKNVSVTFSPPQATSEKEYPLSLVFFTEPLDEPEATGVQPQVTGSIASNIVLLVGQTERDRGKLSVEKISPPFLVDSLGELEFEILAKNTGINATNASGSATITNWQGKKVAQYYFFPDMILANSTRLLRNVVDSVQTNVAALSPQEIEAYLEELNPESITTQFTYDPTFLIGPYTITTEIHSNGQANQSGSQQSQQVSVSSVTVIALPYSIIAVGAVLLIGWAIFYTFKTGNTE